MGESVYKDFRANNKIKDPNQPNYYRIDKSSYWIYQEG